MPSTPHYLRVARALALVSGLAGLPACAMSSTIGTDSGPQPDASETDPDSGGPIADAGDPVLDAGYPPIYDAGHPVYDAGHPVYDAGHPVDDAGPLADGGWIDPCATCECGGWAPVDSGTTAESCESIGHAECCAVIGPLFPPDLAA